MAKPGGVWGKITGVGTWFDQADGMSLRGEQNGGKRDMAQTFLSGMVGERRSAGVDMAQRKAIGPVTWGRD